MKKLVIAAMLAAFTAAVALPVVVGPTSAVAGQKKAEKNKMKPHKTKKHTGKM